MTVQNLSNISFDELLNCFLKAFENYYVKMPTEREYYKERWKATKVDFNFSYGMFDKGKLIGFIIHAIDKRDGILTAFNTGTGVLPEHRRKRIINSIYEQALRDFEQYGIEKITLEVITENKIAIRSYETIGFEIYKNFKCFSGPINLEKTAQFDLEKIDATKFKWENLPNQQFYSWDNQKESLLKGDYSYFQVLNNKEAESFFIIKPDSGYVAQLDLLNTKNNGWNRLFSAIKQISTTIKINNVDERLNEKVNQISAIGLANKVDQFEMELKIKGSNKV